MSEERLCAYFSLLPFFDFRSDQTDLVDSGALGDIDRLGHRLELQTRVAFHEYHGLGTGLKNFLHTRLQLTHVDRIMIALHALVLPVPCDQGPVLAGNRTG